MKLIFVILLVGCVAAIYGFPEQRALEVDWDAAAAKVQTIGLLVANLADYLKKAVDSGTGEVANKIDEYVGRVYAILELVQAHIRDKSLTLNDAVELLTQVENLLQDLQTDIQDDLPPSAAEDVRFYTKIIMSMIHTNAQGVYAIFGLYPDPPVVG